VGIKITLSATEHVYCFIIICVVIHSSFCVYNLAGPRAYQILPKLPAPHKRFSTPDLHAAFTRRTNGQSMGTIQQAVLFRTSGAINIKVLSLFISKLMPYRIKIYFCSKIHITCILILRGKKAKYFNVKAHRATASH